MSGDGALTIHPIGFVRSPFVEKIEAPRQATVAEGVQAVVELLPRYQHALEDLAGFDRIWILFWFDRAADAAFHAKVLPPRSARKRGVFATRSPHRPNPIGMSAVRLERIDGLRLHVRDLDLLDGTPVLDIKPYLAYADAFPEARAGWLAQQEDPRRTWHVAFAPRAERQLAWIADRSSLDLRARIASALALGPEPHPYRRIKQKDGASILAVKDWRATFVVDPSARDALVVTGLTTGYRPRELEKGADEPHVLHRAFVGEFG